MKRLLLLWVIIVSSCSEKEKVDNYLEASTDLISIDYKGFWKNSDKKASFELGANIHWKVTSVDEWITLSHMEGDRGRTTIFIDAKENLTGEDREGLIIIEGNGLFQYIDVYQTLKKEEISIVPTNITVGKSGKLETGDLASIEIETNSDWEVIEADNWIMPDKKSGKEGYSLITLDIEPNNTGDIRVGKLLVSSGKEIVEIIITQELEVLEVTPNVIEVNVEGKIEGEESVNLKINAESSWRIENNATSWISLSTLSGNAGSHMVSLIISKNETGAERYGSLKVITDSNMEEQVVVKQTLNESGATLYYENFDWCNLSLGKIQDPVGTQGKEDDTINLFNNEKAKSHFDNAGLSSYNNETSIYVALGYLKFGKTDVQTGIKLPSLSSLNTKTDVSISFDISTCCTGSGIPDKTKITIEIEGNGSFNKNNSIKKIDNLDSSDGYELKNKKMDIYGMDASTRIIIRSTQQGMTEAGADQFRWFLDNIRISQISNIY